MMMMMMMMMMMADWLVFLCLLKPDPLTATNVDLQDVKIVKQVGGTMDDTELVRGLVLERGVRTYILLHTYIHFKNPHFPIKSFLLSLEIKIFSSILCVYVLICSNVRHSCSKLELDMKYRISSAGKAYRGRSVQDRECESGFDSVLLVSSQDRHGKQRCGAFLEFLPP